MNAGQELEQTRAVAHLAGLPNLDVLLPDERQVIANGMRFHYLDWGGAASQTMLFLHGGGLNAHTWDLICLAMRNDYRCLAVDLRGHGDSEWSPIADYRLDSHRADIEALVDVLGLDKFVLVGMSLGGLTSVAYAGRNAEKLAALVLIDVGPRTRSEGTKRIRDFSTAPEGLDSIEAFVERAHTFNPLRHRDVLRRSLSYNLRQALDGKWTFKHDQRRYESGGQDESTARREQLWADIARIACPTLVVRGGKSDVFLDEDAEELANALPDGRWVKVEGAGHTVQGDQPKALIGELRRFLSVPPLE